MNTGARIAAVAWVLGASVLASSAGAGSSDFTFAVLGDMPYDAAQEATFNTALAPALGRSGLPFVIHLGDIKSGGQACTDDLIVKRRDEIYALLPGRVFYTPGDNEWTDCDRKFLESPKPEMERLDRLREVFFPAPLKVPDVWDLATQHGYPENARWTVGGLVFATIHLVGTNNGRIKINPLDGAGKALPEPAAAAYVNAALDRVEARDAANARWLEQAFAQATGTGARAVIVATQADVTGRKSRAPCTAGRRSACDGFADARAKLTALAAAFAKPVLLIHGDTDPFCLDRAFGGGQAPKLWRLNALGDFTEIDATLVTVGGPGAGQAFTVKRLMTGGLLDKGADCR